MLISSMDASLSGQHHHSGTKMPSGASAPSFNIRHLTRRPALRVFRQRAFNAWEAGSAAGQMRISRIKARCVA